MEGNRRRARCAHEPYTRPLSWHSDREKHKTIRRRDNRTGSVQGWGSDRVSVTAPHDRSKGRARGESKCVRCTDSVVASTGVCGHNTGPAAISNNRGPVDTLCHSTARPPTDSQARINRLTCLFPGRRHSVRDASSIRRSVIAKKCGRTRAFRITRQVPSDRHSADEAGIDLARRHGRGAARGIAEEMVTSTRTSGRLPGAGVARRDWQSVCLYLCQRGPQLPHRLLDVTGHLRRRHAQLVGHFTHAEPFKVGHLNNRLLPG